MKFKVAVAQILHVRTYILLKQSVCSYHIPDDILLAVFCTHFSIIFWPTRTNNLDIFVEQRIHNHVQTSRWMAIYIL